MGRGEAEREAGTINKTLLVNSVCSAKLKGLYILQKIMRLDISLQYIHEHQSRHGPQKATLQSQKD